MGLSNSGNLEFRGEHFGQVTDVDNTIIKIENFTSVILMISYTGFKTTTSRTIG